jgi:putative FmdB family regulatory protein
MPIYGFECKSCGSGFETLVRASEVPSCPSCGSGELERQLSLIAAPAKSDGFEAPPCAGGGPGACGFNCPGQGGCG